MAKPIIEYLTGKGVFLVHCSAIANSRLHCGIIFIDKGVEEVVRVIDPATGDRYDILLPRQYHSPLFDKDIWLKTS